MTVVFEHRAFVEDCVPFTKAGEETVAINGADCGPPVDRIGDINGDGCIDRADMSLILAARNQQADGPDDPRDLDGDGVITVNDARRLVTLCDVRRCGPCP